MLGYAAVGAASLTFSSTCKMLSGGNSRAVPSSAGVVEGVSGGGAEGSNTSEGSGRFSEGEPAALGTTRMVRRPKGCCCENNHGKTFYQVNNQYTN